VMEKNGTLTLRPGADANFKYGGVGGGGIGGGGAYAVTNVTGRNQIAWSDGRQSLEMEMRNGRAVTLRAKDRAGKELFNGPVETDAQREALAPDMLGALVKAESGTPFGKTRGTSTRVLTSTDQDTLMVARFDAGNATHVFAFSTADGKTLFDGPVVKIDERKAMPEAVAKQLETLEKNQSAAGEFGVVGRDGDLGGGIRKF
jgi:hypothetical protein